MQHGLFLSLLLHILVTLIFLYGADLSFFTRDKNAHTPIPVELVMISKESQGAIAKPEIVDKIDDKVEEKLEVKKDEVKPEEKPKLKPQSAPKEEVQELKQEEKKEEKEKPKPEPQKDEETVALKKKDKPKKEEKKKKEPDTKKKKEVEKKDPKKDKIKDKKKDNKKTKNDEDFDQILKNLDTKPAPSKDDTKKESKGKKQNLTNKFSEEAKMSLIDAMKRQVMQCWNLDAGIRDIEKMSTVLHIKLKPDGEIETIKFLDQSRMDRDPFFRSFVESTRRAVLECAPYNLPPDMYEGNEGWKEIELEFDPNEMLDQVQ